MDPPLICISLKLCFRVSSALTPFSGVHALGSAASRSVLACSVFSQPAPCAAMGQGGKSKQMAPSWLLTPYRSSPGNPSLHSLTSHTPPLKSTHPPVSQTIWSSPPHLLFLPLCTFAHVPHWARNVLFCPTLFLGKYHPSLRPI